MLGKFKPDSYKQSVFEITPEYLRKHKIKGIITDLDNTLVEWNRMEATDEIIAWFELMRSNDIQIAIVSNNNEERVGNFATPHQIPFFHRARKPLVTHFKNAIDLFQLSKSEVCVIGDQLLTDIFGGNRLGVHTILVQPVASTDGFFTRFNRRVEKIILYSLRKNGKLTWKDE